MAGVASKANIVRIARFNTIVMVARLTSIGSVASISSKARVARLHAGSLDCHERLAGSLLSVTGNLSASARLAGPHQEKPGNSEKTGKIFVGANPRIYQNKSEHPLVGIRVSSFVTFVEK